MRPGQLPGGLDLLRISAPVVRPLHFWQGYRRTIVQDRLVGQSRLLAQDTVESPDLLKYGDFPSSTGAGMLCNLP
jgi:hypothetical protein